MPKKKNYEKYEAEHGTIADEAIRSIIKAMYEETAYETLTDTAFETLHRWIRSKA